MSVRGKNGQFVKKNAPVKDDGIVGNPIFSEPKDDIDKSVKKRTEIALASEVLLGDKRPLLTRDPLNIGIEEYQPKSETIPLKCYHLYHVIDDDQIGKENEGRVSRMYIGTFYAIDLEHAFEKCTHNDADYQQFGEIRDTMTGDVLCDDYGFYMICQQGFKLIAVLSDIE